MASYATPADLLKRYDARVVGDLVSDTDVQADPNELTTNAVLLQMLADASGDIESALLVGERYSLENLQAYNATTNPSGLTENSLALLQRMTCDIAYALLLRRRGTVDPDRHAAVLDLAEKYLKDLRSGAAVFGIQAQEEAGRASYTGVRTVDFAQLNLQRDHGHYYPTRRIRNGW